MQTARSPVTFSLLELFALFLAVGVGAAALKFSDRLGPFVQFAAFLVVAALTVIAIVARGRLQAFAIGFVVPVLLYAAALYVSGPNELDPRSGGLLTTRAIGAAYTAVIQGIDGEDADDRIPVTLNVSEIRDASDITIVRAAGQTFTIYGPAGGFDMLLPDPTTFGKTGHILIALALGYAGGKFAVALFVRRQRGEATSESPPGTDEPRRSEPVEES